MDHIQGTSIRALAVTVSLVALVCMFPAGAWARVSVDDNVVVKGERVMLRAETKGKFFSKGGELVEFFVDGESIGKTLSGGDGVAYKPLTPQRTGLHKIKVTSGGDEDTGLLLALERGSGIVFVDVEGAISEGPFSREPRPGSQEGIRAIQKRLPVVLLQRGLFNAKAMKQWLQENEFIELPVVSWRKGAIFDEAAEGGLRIEAVIGAPKVIESAMEHNPQSFSFEQAEGAEWVGDWEEINKKLK
jgi:hypothetical protein